MAHNPTLSVIENERQLQITRMEATGSIHPDCETCKRTFYAAEAPVNVMAPRHTASRLCESGKRPHCTCSACF